MLKVILLKRMQQVLFWELTRKLTGDFSEIVKKTELNENIAELDEEQLLKLQLTEQGRLPTKCC
jgi:hypothetical protein